MVDKKAESKNIPVTIIDDRGSSALVEYTAGGLLKRAIVPSSSIQDGSAAIEALDLGIPYGLPWESMLELKATPEALAQALRERGIWTIEDLRKNPQMVYGAIQFVYGVDLGNVINSAEKIAKGGS